ncbi:hypothetical protein [Holdemania sp. 1001302B_160321_E10]|uniref:hypothetical protein n=1 Tax=Holdemania sp. 1001302B_160321_E10 TaxID=2787120 RepID=UPI00189A8D66|nr:hypothetical protein [Holdemania sp. 1001302B_160321_E10]
MTKEEWQAIDEFEIAAAEAGGYVQPPKPMTEEEKQAEREKILAWIKKHKEEQRQKN